jgi:hypothetical protein
MAESNEMPIWRYMDLARYVSLLDRGIFFARPDRFTDPWEGTWGGRDLLRFREDHGHLSLDDLEKEWKTIHDRRKTARARIGVSCWHESPHESAALWELYLPRGLGVAIKSTTTHLLDGMQGSQRAVEAVELTYEDYRGLELGSDVKKLLSFKRSEFQHEREIRFLLDFNPDEIYEMNALSVALEDRQTRQFPAGVPQPMWGRLTVGPQHAPRTDPTAVRRVAPDGVHLDSDLKHIIDRVVLAPNVHYATRRAVIAVTEAFGLDRKIVIDSSVDQVPYDHVSFFDPNVTKAWSIK